MSPETGPSVEVLIARKRPWRKRLWIRVVLVVTLIGTISSLSFWVPRRTMFAVWWVRGGFSCEADRPTAVNVMRFLNKHFRWKFSAKNLDNVSFTLGLLRTDAAVTGVDLSKSKVDDQWLIRLKRFPELKYLGLHDRQLGPGLDHLRDHDLRNVGVTAASTRLSEIHRLSQIQDLALWSSETDQARLDALSSLPQLSELFISDCADTTGLLRRLPDLPNVQSFTLQNCEGFSDDDLGFLQMMPGLKNVWFNRTALLGDRGLAELAQLSELESLALHQSLGSVTDKGLQPLKQLTKLQRLSLVGTPLSRSQVDMLDQLLPNAQKTIK